MSTKRTYDENGNQLSETVSKKTGIIVDKYLYNPLYRSCYYQNWLDNGKRAISLFYYEDRFSFEGECIEYNKYH